MLDSKHTNDLANKELPMLTGFVAEINGPVCARLCNSNELSGFVRVSISIAKSKQASAFGKGEISNCEKSEGMADESQRETLKRVSGASS